jgi:hypothetical protein
MQLQRIHAFENALAYYEEHRAATKSTCKKRVESKLVSIRDGSLAKW